MIKDIITTYNINFMFDKSSFHSEVDEDKHNRMAQLFTSVIF